MKKYILLLSLFALLYSSCSNPSGGTTTESLNVTVLVNGEVPERIDQYGRIIVSAESGKMYDIQFETDNLDIGLYTSFGVVGGLSPEYRRGNYTLQQQQVRYTLPQGTSDGIGFMYINRSDTGEEVASILFYVEPASYAFIPFSEEVVHGESAVLTYSSNVDPQSITWTSLDPENVSIEVPNPNVKEIKVNGLVNGIFPLRAEFSGNNGMEIADSDICVAPRDASIEYYNNYTEVLFLGESIDLQSALYSNFSFDTPPSLTIEEPDYGLTFSRYDETLLSVEGSVITAIETGSCNVRVDDEYSSSISNEEYKITVLPVFQDLEISGTVTDGPGSFAVSGSTIDLYKYRSDTVLASTVADSDGKFTFSGLDSGFYSLVASQTGKAASRLEHLLLFESNREIEIVHKDIEDPTSIVEPPEIILKEENSVAPMYTTNSLSIYARFGDDVHTSQVEGAYDLGLFVGPYNGIAEFIGTNSMYTSFSYSLNTSKYQAGVLHEASIVCNDANNNRNQYFIPFINDDEEGTTTQVPATSSHEVYLESITLGDSQQFYSAAAESAHYVRIMVKNGSNLDSINIYRGTNSDELQKVGVVKGSISGTMLGVPEIFSPSNYTNWFLFIDTDPKLEPGQSYFYKIAYVNDGNEGPLSRAIEATVLPKYNLTLQEPANEAELTTDPHFSWSYEQVESLWANISYEELTSLLIRRSYHGLISGDPIEIPFGNTSYNHSESLPDFAGYVWDVLSMRRVVNESTGSSLSESFSYPRRPISSYSFSSYYNDASLPLSNNGSFSFDLSSD